VASTSADDSAQGPRARSSDGAASDFGTKLRLARERRGISLREIAIATKISITALEALERNDPSRLPGGIFSRSFVRAFAAEVGLDPEQTVREFVDRFPTEAAGTPSSQAVDISEEQFDSQRRMLSALVWLALVSVPLAGIVIYYSVLRAPSVDGAAADPAAQVASADDSGAAQGAVEVPGMPPQPPDEPAPAANLPEVASALRLELKPSGPCWIALAVDGGPKVSRLMQGGETYVQRAEDEILLEVGDAGALVFTLNDAPGRSLGRPGQVVVNRITRENYRTFLQP
jgi:cytoskeletal protein RodZ